MPPVESFNGRLRDELPPSETFDTLAETWNPIDRWRIFRSQRSIGGR